MSDTRTGNPNVRIHLRGGTVIETRCQSVEAGRSQRDGNGLVSFDLRGTEPGWPKTTYLRLDAVDAIEWIGELGETP